MADLMTALRNAHDAGDAEGANRIATMIKEQNQGGIVDSFVEPAASIGANVIGNIGSGLGGIYELIKTGDIDSAANAVQEMQSNIQQEYAPQTKAGKRGLENVTGALQSAEENIIQPAIAGTAGLADIALNPVSNIAQGFDPAKQTVQAVKKQGLGDAAGSEVFEKTGSPLLATLAETFGETAPDLAGGLFAISKIDTPKFKPAKKINPTQAKIAEEIKAGTADVDLVKKMVDQSGNIVKDKKAIETIKQGFDEGVIATVKGSSATDKRRMAQMIDKLEKGKKNARYAAENRPADAVGESLLKQVDFIRKNNSDAGKQLSRVASKLKGEKADINTAVNSFIKDAEGMGVSFNDNFVPDFTGSTIETISPAKKLIKDITLKIRRNPNPDAFDAHQFKKFIDENVTFGKSAKGLGGKTEAIAKKLRSGVNESLGDSFLAYKEANTRFADTISVLESIQDASGSKVNLFGPNSEKALGTVLRRLMSNTQSRVNLIDSIKDIKYVSQKYGGSFDDDILSQMLFADELDSMFGTAGRTTFAGQVQRGTKRALETAGGEGGVFRTAVDLTADAAEKLRGINEKNAIKSIKELLKEK